MDFSPLEVDLVNLGDLELMVDNTEDAMAYFDRAEEIYLNLGMTKEIPLLLISKGLAYYQRNEHDQTGDYRAGCYW
jgi:hypothetical protein